jgi:hypothetical protein
VSGLRGAPLLLATVGFALVAAAASTPAATASRRPRAPIGPAYRVAEVTGRAYAWIPWRGEWQEVRPGLVLPEGTLLQSLGATAITFRPRGGDATPLRTRLDAPAMFRLQTATLREPSPIDPTLYVPRAMAALPPGVKPPPKRAVPVVAVAASRPGTSSAARAAALAAVRTPLEPPAAEPDARVFPGPPPGAPQASGTSFATLLADLKQLAGVAAKPLTQKSTAAAEAGTTVRRLTSELRVRYPSDGGVFLSSGKTDRLFVAWDVLGEPAARPAVQLYVWRSTAERGAPVATSDAEVIPFSVCGRGGYFLQVATTDGAYASHPVYFVIE